MEKTPKVLLVMKLGFGDWKMSFFNHSRYLTFIVLGYMYPIKGTPQFLALSK